jgi:hypothetical protein
MYNSRANQLTEMVPLERIERELGRMARAGATEYLLINTSDIRPVVMTTRAVMELAWRAQPWVEGGEAARFVDRWSQAEFGERSAPALSEYYRSYFLAPGRYGNGEPETFSDNAYHTFARHILVDMVGGKGGVPIRYFGPSMTMREYVQIMARSAAAAEPKWREARMVANRASRLIPRDRTAFFQAHVLTQLDVHEYSNRALRNIAEAWLENNKIGKITAAVSDLKNVVAALQAAETGRWAGFYRRELFTNVRHTLALAEACAGKLEGKPLPAGLPIAVRPVDPYIELKAYQGGRRTPL